MKLIYEKDGTFEAGNYAFQILAGTRGGFWRGGLGTMNGCFQPDFVNEVRRPDEANFRG